MNEQAIESTLRALLESIAATDRDDLVQVTSTMGLEDVEDELANLQEASVQTFDYAGLLTRDRGLVIRLQSGDEFQVTIKRSAWGQGSDDE